MSEDREKLRATIAELHAELDAVDATDDEVQQLLHGALREIQETLEEGSAADAPPIEDEPSSVIERLRKAAQHYEDDHPTLSGILGSIIDTLSRTGI